MSSRSTQPHQHLGAPIQVPNLLVNVSSLVGPRTGVGHYSAELLRVLLRCAPAEHLRGMVSGQLISSEQLQNLLDPVAGDGAPQRARLRGLVGKLPGARRAHRSLQNLRARRYQPRPQELYWEPNFLSLPVNLPSVITVHDLSHLHYPQYHPRDRVRSLGRLLPQSVARAQVVTCVSAFTAQALKAEFAPAHEPVIVAPAVAAEFCPLNGTAIERVRAKYQLPEQFILSVGTLEPRKNLSRLIDAYRQLPQALRDVYPLVLVGARGWHDRQLLKQVAPMARRGELQRLGYIDQDDLPAVYNAASVMCYPSLYEGFGMPIIESMACGTPVLTSNITATAEVAADAAQLADPHDTDSIACALNQLLEDETLRQHYRERGLQRAQYYTWPRAAQQLLSAFALARERA